MDWLFYAILAPLVYAVVVFVDKYILEKEITDYRGMPIYSAFIATIFGFIIWVLTGLPLLSPMDGALVMLTGILTIFGLATYFKALSDDEASKIQILFQMTPVITLILAYLFLKETITIHQFFGFLLILASTIGVSVNKTGEAIKISPSFVYIFLTDFFWSSAFVIFKFVIEDNAFIKVIAFESWGIGLGGLILYIFFPSVKKAFFEINKRVRSRALFFITLNEGFFLLSRLFTYLAISKGPVALVDVVAGTQVFFAIIYGWILTLIVPSVFQEDITGLSIIKKALLGILVLSGLWFIKG